MRQTILSNSKDGNTVYLADNAYLAIIPEVTAGTPVKPTNFVPLVSESIKTITNTTPDKRMFGVDWNSTTTLRGFRSHEGDFTVLCDPDTLSHLLNATMYKASTSGSPPTLTHTFNTPTSANLPKTYTIEIKRGVYAQRFFGVRIDQLKLSFQDGQMLATVSIAAMGQFGVATVGVALTGAAMTSVSLDDNYDINPTRGLLTTDVIAIALTAGGTTNVTITSITPPLAVGFGSTSITAAVGLPVYLVPQTVSYPTLQDPFYMGNVRAGFGATTSAAATAAGAVATATPLYDLEITINNNLFKRNGTTYIDPAQIFIGSKQCHIKCKQLLTETKQRLAFQDRAKQAITLIITGQATDTPMASPAKATFTFNNVKLMSNDHNIKVGEYIYDEQEFEVLYDTGDAQAMAVVLINSTASASL